MVVLLAMLALNAPVSIALSPPTAVPSVTVPSVHTPVGSTAAISTPAVKVPSLSAPAISTPAVHTPAISVPALVVVKAVSVASPPAAAATALATAIAPAALPRTTAGGVGATNVPTASIASTHSAARKPAPAPLPGRYLRRLVRRLESCMVHLPPQSQRLLVLRTGLAGGRSMPAAAAARMLHMSAGAEIAAEHAAVRSLNATAREGRCGGSGSFSPAAALATAPTFTALPTSGAAAISDPFSITGQAATPATDSAGGSSHSKALSQSATVIETGGISGGNLPLIQRAAISSPRPTSSVPLTAVMLAVLALLGAVVIAVLQLQPLRRSRMRGGEAALWSASPTDETPGDNGQAQPPAAADPQQWLAPDSSWNWKRSSSPSSPERSDSPWPERPQRKPLSDRPL